MGHVGVLETARDQGDGVAVADVGQELVAEALALGRAAHQAGDVDEGDPRRDDLFRLGDRRQSFQARFRHRDLADVRLDGAKGIVRRLRIARARDCVKEGALPDVGETDDSGA